MNNVWITQAKNTIKWLLAHWYVPFGVFASAVVYGMRRQGATPGQRLQVELDAAQAKLEVSAIAAEHGADAAHDHIEKVYAKQIANLSEQECKDAETLGDSPPALAAYLVRAAVRQPPAPRVDDGSQPPSNGTPS